MNGDYRVNKEEGYVDKQLVKNVISAILHNDAGRVKGLLAIAESSGVLRRVMMHRDHVGFSVLHHAVEKVNLEVVNALLKSTKNALVERDLVLLPSNSGSSCLVQLLASYDDLDRTNKRHHHHNCVMQALLDVGGRALARSCGLRPSSVEANSHVRRRR